MSPLKKVLLCMWGFAFCVQPMSLHAQVMCAPPLKSYLSKIEQLAEARKLLEAIQKEGNIRMVVDNSELSRRFGAFWNMDQRVICVNPSWHRSEGNMIGSIIFELHNALATSKFRRLEALACRRQINRSTYIKEMERLEYLNSVQAAALVEKGVGQGLFPPSARLPIYDSFEEHFRAQHQGGHAAQIGDLYDRLIRT